VEDRGRGRCSVTMMKFCLGCSRHVRVEDYRNGRCLDCSKTYERDRSRRRRRTAGERTRRQTLIQEHVRVCGWVCPGYGVPQHPSRDLTADHVVPVAKGGHEEGELRVLCRSCNSRRGAGPTRAASSNHPRPVLRETNSGNPAPVAKNDLLVG
jgi:5-methylcytosine-specific restriction enzyme A